MSHLQFLVSFIVHVAVVGWICLVSMADYTCMYLHVHHFEAYMYMYMLDTRIFSCFNNHFSTVENTCN